MGSIPPYGYTVKDGKLYKRNEKTVEVVKFIFNSFLKSNAYTKIAYTLNEKGYDTPGAIAGKSNAGKLWYDTSIKKILSNPHYVGDIVQGRETSISVTNKKRQSVPQNQWVIVSDTHEPIISREDFERVQ